MTVVLEPYSMLLPSRLKTLCKSLARAGKKGSGNCANHGGQGQGGGAQIVESGLHEILREGVWCMPFFLKKTQPTLNGPD